MVSGVMNVYINNWTWLVILNATSFDNASGFQCRRYVN